MKYIHYKEGYKYQLAKKYQVDTEIYPIEAISTRYISLYQNGKLTIKKGYAWDGPSGPTIDTPNFMRGSLVHDALYQLMREKELEPYNRDAADRLLQKICKEDGMSSFRAWYVYQSLAAFGGAAASPDNIKKIIKAPVDDKEDEEDEEDW